jgi:hypothetical protein
VFARNAAYGSLAFAVLAVVGALAAFAQWSSGSPGPGLAVSVVSCVVGFGCAIGAEAVGSDRHELRLGLAGLITNLLIGVFWAVLAFSAWSGS